MKLVKYKSYDTDYYTQTLKLRNDVLRRPLGKSIFDEDLTIERENDFYGWVKENQIIATLSTYVKESKTIHLTAFAVAPTYQNQGYGKGLITFLIEDLDKQVYERLSVFARATAKDFYEKCGFTVAGEVIENSILGIDDYLMTRNINKELNLAKRNRKYRK